MEQGKSNLLVNQLRNMEYAQNVNNLEKLLKTIKMPKTDKQVRRLIVFVQNFQKFIPNIAVKRLPFFKLLRNDQEFLIKKEYQESLAILKSDFARFSEISSKIAKTGRKFVIVSDARCFFRGIYSSN